MTKNAHSFIKVLIVVGLCFAVGVLAPQLIEKFDAQLQLSIIGGLLCH
jgi:hypothetical protein